MEYTIKPHETTYKDVLFRSRLEARWAAFFDLVGWTWEYEPIDFGFWTPDFYVAFPCSHSECNGFHSLFVEVKPYFSIRNFSGHPCTRFYYGGLEGTQIPADSSACFGINPNVTYWEMVHGNGGGSENVEFRVRGDIDALWKEAGNIVQYKPK